MPQRINTFNRQAVSVQYGNEVVVLVPMVRMSAAEAITHAAWLVAMAQIADPDCPSFGDVLAAVENT